MSDNLYPPWFPDQPGWLILSRPERGTLIVLHRCGLWVEAADIKWELDVDEVDAVRAVLVDGANAGLTGRHSVRVARHGNACTVTLEKSP